MWDPNLFVGTCDVGLFKIDLGKNSNVLASAEKKAILETTKKYKSNNIL